MGVIYSGQTISNSTLDGSTASNLATALETALAAAGWSLIQSGSSGSQWWRMRSVATPAGFSGGRLVLRGQLDDREHFDERNRGDGLQCRISADRAVRLLWHAARGTSIN